MNDQIDHDNKSWFNIPNLLITIAFIFLLVLTIWNQTISEELFARQEMKETMEVTPSLLPPEQSPIPSEFYSDPADTSGIITAAVVLLLIILGSAIWKLRTTK